MHPLNLLEKGNQAVGIKGMALIIRMIMIWSELFPACLSCSDEVIDFGSKIYRRNAIIGRYLFMDSNVKRHPSA
ncbi:hypothetical protein D3C77_562940 [compost metagenome]